jgi:hypothetical protein
VASQPFSPASLSRIFRLRPFGPKPGQPQCAPAECGPGALLKSLAKLPGPVSDQPRRCIPPPSPTQYTQAGFIARPWAFRPAGFGLRLRPKQLRRRAALHVMCSITLTLGGQPVCTGDARFSNDALARFLPVESAQLMPFAVTQSRVAASGRPAGQPAGSRSSSAPERTFYFSQTSADRHSSGPPGRARRLRSRDRNRK